MTDADSMVRTDSDPLNLQQGLCTAMAAAVAYWLTDWLGLPGGYWAVISAIVVTQSAVGATVKASGERFAGTAIGAVVGWLTALVWHHSIVVFAFAVLIVMLLCSALKFVNAGRLAGVTIAIIVLIPYPGTAWQIAGKRFLEVSVGILVSLGVALGWNKANMLFGRESS